MKGKYIRADSEFIDFIDNIGDEISKEFGWERRRISRSMVTRYLTKKYKKEKGGILL